MGARTSSLGQAGREILIESTLICRFPLNSSFHLLKAKTFVQPGDVGRPDRGAGGSEEPGLHLELLKNLLPGENYDLVETKTKTDNRILGTIV